MLGCPGRGGQWTARRRPTPSLRRFGRAGGRLADLPHPAEGAAVTRVCGWEGRDLAPPAGPLAEHDDDFAPIFTRGAERLREEGGSAGGSGPAPCPAVPRGDAQDGATAPGATAPLRGQRGPAPAPRRARPGAARADARLPRPPRERAPRYGGGGGAGEVIGAGARLPRLFSPGCRAGRRSAVAGPP